MPRARQGGSWVQEPIDVFDGEKRFYIYKRPKTAKWQLYIKTEKEGVIRLFVLLFYSSLVHKTPANSISQSNQLHNWFAYKYNKQTFCQ